MSEFETLRYLITRSKEVIADAEILLDKTTTRMEELYTGNWATPNEFFTRTQANDYLDYWKPYAVRTLMLEYSQADAELHRRCCMQGGQYPNRFWVAADINNALDYGADMAPWAVY